MMQDSLYHNRMFKHDDGTQQIVVPLGKLFESPEMSAVSVARIPVVDNIKQHRLGNLALRHAATGVARN